MSVSPVSSLLSSPMAPSGDSIGQPKNAAEAAQQFEALLLAQMLRTANSADASLDSEGGDASKETMWDMAAQQFAQVLAKNGGMGLARMISTGLQPPHSQATQVTATQVTATKPAGPPSQVDAVAPAAGSTGQ